MFFTPSLNLDDTPDAKNMLAFQPHGPVCHGEANWTQEVIDLGDNRQQLL
jgi:hypothetical protein